MSAADAPAALLAALRERTSHIPADRIDRVWLFGERPVGPARSSLAVLSLFAADDPAGRREVLTLHCTADADRGRPRRTDHLVEQGSVPHDRLARMIQGVVQRLRDDSEVPHAEEIAGSAERWARLLAGARAA